MAGAPRLRARCWVQSAPVSGAHLAAAGACRRAWARLGHPRWRTAEDGHLRTDTPALLDDERDLHAVCAAPRYTRRGLGPLRSFGRLRAARTETADAHPHGHPDTQSTA